MEQFVQWIGRTQSARDNLGEPLARRWLATFDRPARDEDSTGMPQGVHWCLCVPDTQTGRLGRDGHPVRDASPSSFLPPIAAPRRMWAGSDIRFRAPIAVGAAVERISSLEEITEKTGASGPLIFVTISHETYADGRRAVSETQTLVYRDATPAGAPPMPPPLSDTEFTDEDWDSVRRITPTSALLFRYSALTFNTHRIHYDADYARGEEGYRGLVVHAPLTASLLLQHAARRFGENALERFSFRGTSPAIAGEELVLALRGTGENIELGAFAADGRQVMKATAALKALKA